MFDGCSNFQSIKLLETQIGSNFYSSEDGKLIFKTTSKGVELAMVVPFVTSSDEGRVVSLPSEVSDLDSTIFKNSNVNLIKVDKENQSFSDYRGALYSKDFKTLVAVPTGLVELELHSDLENIPNEVIDRAKSLKVLNYNGSSDLSIGIINKTSLNKVNLNTTGNIMFGKSFGYSPYLSDISLTCNELIMRLSTSIVDSESYDLDLNLKEKGTFSKLISSGIRNLSVNGIEGLEIENWFADGVKYSIESIEINNKPISAENAILCSDVQIITGETDVNLRVSGVYRNGMESYVEFQIISSESGLTINDISIQNGKQYGDSIRVPALIGGVISVEVNIKENSEKVTISFDSHEGTEIESIQISSGRTILPTQLKNPTKTGYEFKGWYTSASLDKEYNREPVIQDMTLHARWSLNEGFVLTYEDVFGLVDVRYEDGRAFYSGEKLSNEDFMTFTFESGNGVEFLGWSVREGTNITEERSELKGITLDDNTFVMPLVRCYSTSNALINTTNLPTPDWEDVNIVWKNQYSIDTSMSTWTGFPSIPVIVDNNVFVRANDDLIKMDLNTGTVVKKVTVKNTTAHAYYHYLGYGGDVIFDYMTGNAYDLDLNYLYHKTLDGKKFSEGGKPIYTAVFYDNGYFYGLGDGKLWKFNSKTGEDIVNDGWKDGVEVRWHGIYGTTSTPVFNDGWIFFVEVDGNKRMIGAVNLEDGTKEQITLSSKFESTLIDDGWLTHYKWPESRGGDNGDYFFLTTYNQGLFDGSNESSKICCVKFTDGKFTDTEKWLEFKSSSAASALVIVDGRGYVNVSGADSVIGTQNASFYVIDIDKFLSTDKECWTYASKNAKLTDLIYGCKDESGNFQDYGYMDDDGKKMGKFLIYAEESIYTHGSIVVSTSYKDSTGKVYIYLLPYQASEQAVYMFEDHDGKVAPTGYLRSSPVGENFGSQAVRVGPQGQLIWYTDSGTLWCVQGVSKMNYQFLIQDVNGVQLVESNGANLEATLIDALDQIQDGEIETVELDGLDPSVYVFTNDWLSIKTDDGRFANMRSFVVSSVMLTDPDAGSDSARYLDPNKAVDVYYILEDNEIKEYRMIDIMNLMSSHELNNMDIESGFSKVPLCKLTIDVNGGSAPAGFDTVLAVAEGTENYDFTGIGEGLTRQGYLFDGILFEGEKLGALNLKSDKTIQNDAEITIVWKWGVESTNVENVSIKSDSALEGSDQSFTKTLTGGDQITLKPVFTPSSPAHTEVRWTSSDTSVITVEGGVVNAVAPGSAVVTVITDDGGYMAKCTFTVQPAEIKTVSIDTSKNMFVGEKTVLVPDYGGDYASSVKSISWKSSDPTVVNVNSNGELTAISKGTAVITVTVTGATDGAETLSATCVVKVSEILVDRIVLDENTLKMSVGSSQALIVSIGPDDAANKVVKWISSNTSVATVDDNGIITAVSAGMATITATTTDGSKLNATCTVTVTKVPVTISLSQSSNTMKVGDTCKLTVTIGPASLTDKRVSWSSSNPLVANVDQNGNVFAVKDGNAVITVASLNDPTVTATCSITVMKEKVTLKLTPNSITMDSGKTFTLNAVVGPSTIANKNVSWSSSDSSVATVDQNGVVKAIQSGKATIPATSREDQAVKSKCVVTVKSVLEGISLDHDSISLNTSDNNTAKLTYTLNPKDAMGYTVLWSTDDSSVVKVNNGTVTAVSPGVVKVTAKVSGTDFYAICVVSVTDAQIKEDTKTNTDGNTVKTVTETVDAGNGTTMETVTETVTTKDNQEKGREVTSVIKTEGSNVTTEVKIVTDEKGNTSTEAKTFVKADVKTQNGTKIVKVSEKEMDTAIKQAITASASLDVDSVLTLDLKDNSDIGVINTSIPVVSLKKLADGTSSTIKMESGIGSLEFSNKSLNTLADLGKNDFQMGIKKVLEPKLDKNLQDKIENASVFDLSVLVDSNKVHDLGGNVIVTLPFEAIEGKDVNSLIIYHMLDNGETEKLKCTYDAKNGTVSYYTDSFSEFVIGYAVENEEIPTPETPEDGGNNDPGITTTTLALTVIGAGAVSALIGIIVAVVILNRGRN